MSGTTMSLDVCVPVLFKAFATILDMTAANFNHSSVTFSAITRTVYMFSNVMMIIVSMG